MLGPGRAGTVVTTIVMSDKVVTDLRWTDDTSNEYDNEIGDSAESPRKVLIGPMDLVQAGKEVFVKVCYRTLGIEPRTYSHLGRISYHNCVC